jgi:uncharacterized lipoprotein YddW (UPF0748 family)
MSQGPRPSPCLRSIPAALLFAVALPTAALGAANEVRGTWITTTGITATTSTVYNNAATTANMKRLRDIGLNSVYMDCWRNGNTYFDSPTNAAITGNLHDPSLGTRDLLQEVNIQARRNQMSTIGWFQYGLMAKFGNPSSSTTEVAGYMAAHGWLLKNSAGAYTDSSTGFCWMNPLVPQVQTYIKGMLVDAVKNYDLQGIQLDDHFGWPVNFGYNDSYTAAKYLADTGRSLPASPTDANFTAWRSQQLNTFMKDIITTVRDATKASRPGLIISVSPSVYPYSYNTACVDWPTLASSGVLDEVVPQVYRSTASDFARDWSGSGSQVQYMTGRLGDLAAGININGSAGNNDYTTVVKPDLNLVRSTTGTAGHVLWYSDGVLTNEANLTTYYNVAGLGRANRPDVDASLLPAPVVAASLGGNIWQLIVPSTGYYDLIAANGSTWRLEQERILLFAGTNSFTVTSATQVELLFNGQFAIVPEPAMATLPVMLGLVSMTRRTRRA